MSLTFETDATKLDVTDTMITLHHSPKLTAGGTEQRLPRCFCIPRADLTQAAQDKIQDILDEVLPLARTFLEATGPINPEDPAAGNHEGLVFDN